MSDDFYHPQFTPRFHQGDPAADEDSPLSSHQLPTPIPTQEAWLGLVPPSMMFLSTPPQRYTAPRVWYESEYQEHVSFSNVSRVARGEQAASSPQLILDAPPAEYRAATLYSTNYSGFQATSLDPVGSRQLNPLVMLATPPILSDMTSMSLQPTIEGSHALDNGRGGTFATAMVLGQQVSGVDVCHDYTSIISLPCRCNATAPSYCLCGDRIAALHVNAVHESGRSWSTECQRDDESPIEDLNAGAIKETKGGSSQDSKSTSPMAL